MSEMRSSSVRRVSSSMRSSSSSPSVSIGASKSSEKSMKPTPAGNVDPFVVCPFVFPFVGSVPLLVTFSKPVPTATVVLVAPPRSFLLPRRSGMATFAALSGLRMVLS